jgi:hypothetical protein
VAILIICGMAAGWSAARAYDRAGHPPANAVLLRNDQRALAEAVASFPQRVTWQSYSLYDWGTTVSALTAYDFGHYQPADNRWFHNRRNYWDSNFPNMDLPTLKDYVLDKTEEQVDMVVVLTHPDRKPVGMEDYSFSIASFIAAGVQANAAWTHYRDVDSALVGSLGLYLNARRVDVKRSVEYDSPRYVASRCGSSGAGCGNDDAFEVDERRHGVPGKIEMPASFGTLTHRGF